MPMEVLMADDSYAMRAAIQRTLEEEPRIEIVAEASTFAETIQMIEDLSLPCSCLTCACPKNGNSRPHW
jgi:chemotaxis response regulator CheB